MKTTIKILSYPFKNLNFAKIERFQVELKASFKVKIEKV